MTAKRIDFSSSSLIDLKAELFRKQQDFAKKKNANLEAVGGGQLYVKSKKGLFDGKLKASLTEPKKIQLESSYE